MMDEDEDPVPNVPNSPDKEDSTAPAPVRDVAEGYVSPPADEVPAGPSSSAPVVQDTASMAVDESTTPVTGKRKFKANPSVRYLSLKLNDVANSVQIKKSTTDLVEDLFVAPSRKRANDAAGNRESRNSKKARPNDETDPAWPDAKTSRG